MEAGCPPSSHQPLQAAPNGAPRCPSRGLRVLAPDSRGAYQRNVFSEPRLLHLAIQRKALNSLTWDVWFSLINSNPLMSWLPGFLLQNSYVLWLLPSLFRTIPQSYLRGCILGLILSFVCQVKHNSHLWGCAFFQSSEQWKLLKYREIVLGKTGRRIWIIFLEEERKKTEQSLQKRVNVSVSRQWRWGLINQRIRSLKQQRSFMLHIQIFRLTYDEMEAQKMSVTDLPKGPDKKWGKTPELLTPHPLLSPLWATANDLPGKK